MRFDTDTRTQILADLTLDYDPTGSTIDIQIDSTWYPATWQSTPVAAGGVWTQTARTSGYFAGPAATPNGATVLTAGRHHTQTRVTLGGQIIAQNSTPIDVTA